MTLKLFILVDFSILDFEGGPLEYRTAFGRELHWMPDWYISHALKCQDNIKQTLDFCKEKRIHTLSANYFKGAYPVRSNPVVGDFEFDYDLNNVPDLHQFEILYYGGISLDQCIYWTRRLSYANVQHPNKKVVLDCCIQGYLHDERAAGRPKSKRFADLDDYEQYKKMFLNKRNVSSIRSLRNEQ